MVPLLTGRSGTPSAEVNASLPHAVSVGEQATIAVALDNTGDAIIDTVCIRVIVEPATALRLVSATFGLFAVNDRLVRRGYKLRA